ncbi:MULTISPECIES: hypothetical protein [Chryseobacterium]|uniref:Ig-like domain-containing protein n=1 Tax=Chryseobacterium camelliae TaxID=1265445 RepID=A0ABU0TEX8_9FLAO|nr:MULTISPECIES: hypothetical protein [Chryseobacterium]MDT3406581.1 hypothetical protein [Pseudacidovorax intermedius]MDQ1095623.1 hypothetical protein [Chryseobacterium camelliae]MDQ1099559.1 hypothetical protein [Chryseobacterium sp. SORGH_AS_1048]MDR6086906.1 hypothetical protein [Chryseobacterium sp. SORGH_AS_0909]MDR6131280.1 hypothetical protein [Chryseobacterium sp. SORGH_AS_1175]
MKYIHNLFTLIFFININISAQVGINTDKPNAYAGLHISERKDPASASPDKYNGIIIQRYTEAQRDTQLTPNMTAGQNSLMIFNTTENCYNYWNSEDNEWKSLCGRFGKGTFSYNCNADVTVHGIYSKGKELTTSHYLSIRVTVTKPGSYEIAGTTNNGYNFYKTGTFLTTGSYTVNIPGTGIPANTNTAGGGDTVAITNNGVSQPCSPPVQVPVLSDSGTYTMSCGSAIVNGVYKVGTALTSSNTITLPVNVTALGSYTVTTNTVDGISFSASGTFTATGNQNIMLNGAGTPTSTAIKKLTITSDSQGGVSKSCNVNVIVVIPKKILLTIGTSPNEYGYNFSGTAASNGLITTTANYGTLANSIVKYEGWDQIINGTNAPSAAQLTGWTTGSNPVDIIVIGYSWAASTTEAQILANYIAKGGVVLAFSESTGGMQNLLRIVFDASVSTGSVNSAGALYKLPLTNDSILNGPFGDIRGLQWGEDASSTTYATGLPSSEITVYSGDTNISTANPAGTIGRVTAFRHNTLNFIWVGDGGFNSNNGGTSDTICPFVLNANNFPVFKPNYGNGAATYKMNVYNSIFTANAFAWALDKAEHNGINKY